MQDSSTLVMQTKLSALRQWYSMRGLWYPPMQEAAHTPALDCVEAVEIDKETQRIAKLVVIGDCPTAEAQAENKAFSGAEYDLLNRMMAAIGLVQEEVSYFNLVPTSLANEQMFENSVDFQSKVRDLCESIRVNENTMLLVLGELTARALFKQNLRIDEWRALSPLPGILQAIVTYHPRDLLRFPAHKRATWEDLQRLQALQNPR